MKVLLLEDDNAQAELIQEVLHTRGYEVCWFDEGSRLIRYLENATADILLLDWTVPGISGLDVLWWVRKRLGKGLPVLFVTNRIREDDVVMALDAGADDYIVKPVRPQELVARINAQLRRSYPQLNSPDARIEIGRYAIDVDSSTVTLDGKTIETTPREFEIALLLFRNFGRIIPRDNLIKQVWGRDMDKMSRSLDTHIYRVRQKLQIGPPTGLRLRAIYTHGYRLEATGSDEIAGTV